MSVKRQATSELNHENWDQEDPSDHEEMGTFKAAPSEVLEKRVIRTAKRRSTAGAGAAGDEAKKSVFSGFGGFNKTQPSSFDFLANLTNGSKTTNGTGADKSEAPTSSLFSSKPASAPGSGLFSIPTTSSPASKPTPTFGIPTTQSSLFSAASKTSLTQTSESPFKIQAPSSDPKTEKDKGTAANPPSIFGTASNVNKSPFSSNASPSSLFKTSNATTPAANTSSNDSDKKKDDSADKKLQYYAKLKGLNESVSDWIKKHVEETPLCILSPIFKDYEKYLKEIQDEYQGPDEDTKTSSEVTATEKPKITPSPVKSAFGSTNNDAASSAFPSTKPSIFGNQAKSASTDNQGFSFGIKPSSTATTTTSGGFSFGINSTPLTTSAVSSSPFTLTTNTTTGSNGPSAPFSFGTGKPFSFNNVQKPAEPANEEKDEDDEPPKVEFTPVVEENSVFDKRCKIFVKKDGNFADKGVGTLYIKKIEETGKHQLLVRANTSLGNVLLNLILVSSLPIQRLGKNNVMIVCIPTPDMKPPPTPVLIRVKTSEEADDLLETLNKYKA